MLNSGAAQNDSAGDVDEITCGNEITDGAEEPGHGFARENITGEKNTGQNGKESELHGFALCPGFTGDKDAKRKGDKYIGHGKKCQQKDIAMNGHAKNKAHGSKNQAKLKKSNCKIRENFPQEQAEGADGRDKKLFERAFFFFANDGERGEKRGDVEQQNRG